MERCVSADDRFDPEQDATVPTGEYTDTLGIDAAAVTVGVLQEGFGHDRALNMLPNTAPFDNTGHLAISMPAGTDDGLPVGTMFVRVGFNNKTVLEVADAFAGRVEWRVKEFYYEQIVIYIP